MLHLTGLMMYLAVVLLAFVAAAWASAQATYTQWESPEQLPELLANPEVTHILMMRSMTLQASFWDDYEIPQRVGRNLTVEAAPQLLNPFLDFGHVRGKVALLPGVRLRLAGMVMLRVRGGVTFRAGPGYDLLVNVPAAANNTAAGASPMPEVLHENGGFISEYCASRSLLVPANTPQRPASIPGPQLWEEQPQDGCSNATGVPLLQRCWAARLHHTDLAAYAYSLNAVGVLEPAGYVMRARNVVYICMGLLTDECVAARGVGTCMSLALASLPADTFDRLLAGYDDGGGTVAGAGNEAAGDGTEVAGGGGGGGGEEQGSSSSSLVPVLVPALVGGVCGAVLLGTAAWLLVRRRRRAERAALPSKGSLPLHEKAANGGRPCSSGAASSALYGSGVTSTASTNPTCGAVALELQGQSTGSAVGSVLGSAAASPAPGPSLASSIPHSSAPRAHGNTTPASGLTSQGTLPSCSSGAASAARRPWGARTPRSTDSPTARAPAGSYNPREIVTAGSPPLASIPLELRWGEDFQVDMDKVLGAGAFGLVLVGQYRGQDVAVKVLKPSRDAGAWGRSSGLPFATSNDPASREQRQVSFASELEVLSRCCHPNVVTLLGACQAPPRCCLLMELMELSLAQKLAEFEELLPLHEVLQVAMDVALGLAYLHPTIMHRDLKPANILLDAHGTAKLTDFGLARLRNTVMETANPQAGTAPYMAPECFDPVHKLLTHKADMYSWAVVVWEMLTGQQPWRGLNPLVIAVGVHLFKKRLPLDALGEERCPPKLRQLLHECWDADPQRRPSANEVVKRLALVRSVPRPLEAS